MRCVESRETCCFAKCLQVSDAMQMSLVDPAAELEANCSGMLVYPEPVYVDIKAKV